MRANDATICWTCTDSTLTGGLRKPNDDREWKFMGKQWSKREAQILAVVDSTVGMVGNLQGIAGKAMPEIPSLDRPLFEASTEGSQLGFRSSAE